MIDPNLTATELIDAWINGNHSSVIEALTHDHPGLTALVITEGCLSRRLSVEDCNSITNQLIDRRAELVKIQDAIINASTDEIPG